MSTNLVILSNSVHDESTFLEFLSLLMKDREFDVNKDTHEPHEWQNQTIESFLKSAIIWAETTDGEPIHYSIPKNPWQRMAQMLRAGKN
jgi:hypothetical protein